LKNRCVRYRRYALFLLLVLQLSGCSGKGQDANPAPAPAKPESQPMQQEVQSNSPDANSSGLTNSVQVPPAPDENKPPQVMSVKLGPDLVFPDTPVKAEVEVTDPDGDPVSIDYEWKVNGEVVSGQAMEDFDTDGLRKGDLVTVTVTPYDGQTQGKAKESRPIVILNRPPEITSFPPQALSEGVFTYEVTANDPDGDPLQFSLENGPAGMSIDPTSGRIEWPVPTDLSGNFRVRIVVSDRDAKAFQEFSLNLKKVEK